MPQAFGPAVGMCENPAAVARAKIRQTTRSPAPTWPPHRATCALPCAHLAPAPRHLRPALPQHRATCAQPCPSTAPT
ncbi:MAG: hypothetical protein RBR41_10505, partial [Desulfovibrio sp.]|uniref:hypothetical protein n=1 Tax=Desulfovibrio sp. TaxID=885 RepID=UPI002A35D90C